MARVTHDEARKVGCPRCRALTGEPCKRKVSDEQTVLVRDRHHKERIRAALAKQKPRKTA